MKKRFEVITNPFAGVTTMKLKQITAALSLIAAAFSVSAMQPIADAELSQMTGRDGISIIADLKLNLGALKYIDSTKSSSFNLNNVTATGLIATTVDILTGAMYSTGLSDALTARGITAANAPAVISSINASTGYVAASDVLQLAFPAMPATAKGALLNVTVASMSTGNGGASMGGISITDINMGGSKVWIYGH
jgi:hypothetical protein